MKKGRMAEIVKELQGASKMHLKQSKEIEKHIDDMASNKAPSRISDTTNAYIDRKLKKADRKMSKINSSNSDRKNERKLDKANKSLDQASAKLEKRRLQDLRKNSPKSYGDNIFTTPVTNSPINFKGANSSNSSCWEGHKKVGTKKSPSGTGETVNDCEKI